MTKTCTTQDAERTMEKKLSDVITTSRFERAIFLSTPFRTLSGGNMRLIPNQDRPRKTEMPPLYEQRGHKLMCRVCQSVVNHDKGSGAPSMGMICPPGMRRPLRLRRDRFGISNLVMAGIVMAPVDANIAPMRSRKI